MRNVAELDTRPGPASKWWEGVRGLKAGRGRTIVLCIHDPDPRSVLYRLYSGS